MVTQSCLTPTPMYLIWYCLGTESRMRLLHCTSYIYRPIYIYI